jgi:insertion element IS1 protein InsB
MQSEYDKCYQPVDDEKSCIYCHGKCVKNGKTYGKQRFLCSSCRRCFVSSYTYAAYGKNISSAVKEHVKEGCGIRSIARLLKIGISTVLRKIVNIARSIPKPIIMLGKEYELDEIRTYVQKKSRLLWIVYAIRKDTKEVVDFTIGGRTNQTLKRVTDTLLLSHATKVFTDRLSNYRFLLPAAIHCTKQYGTNSIERKNLSLRTHLKRLNRKTICFPGA